MRIDVGTFAFLLALLALGYYLKTIWYGQNPSLPVSNLAPFLGKKSYRSFLGLATEWFFWASLLFLLVAISHPRKVEEFNSQKSYVRKEIPRSGVALYFLLDQSGSMKESVTIRNASGSRVEVPKIDLAKQAIMEFVEGKQALGLPGRKNDLVGLMAFARVPEVLCPLTLNRAEIAAQLAKVEPVKEDTRNGTAIGYAIFKAVNIIVATKHFAKRQEQSHKSVYNITNQALIIITDGLQSPHPEDKENPFRFMPPDEAINYAKDNDVRVFYIGIDPILAKSDFAHDIQEMKKSMQQAGGDLFLVNSSFPIEDILSQIDKMEKSALPPEFQALPIHEVSLMGFFVTIAMISLLLGVFFETALVRSAP